MRVAVRVSAGVPVAVALQTWDTVLEVVGLGVAAREPVGLGVLVAVAWLLLDVDTDGDNVAEPSVVLVAVGVKDVVRDIVKTPVAVALGVLLGASDGDLLLLGLSVCVPDRLGDTEIRRVWDGDEVGVMEPGAVREAAALQVGVGVPATVGEILAVGVGVALTQGDGVWEDVGVGTAEGGRVGVAGGVRVVEGVGVCVGGNVLVPVAVAERLRVARMVTEGEAVRVGDSVRVLVLVADAWPEAVAVEVGPGVAVREGVKVNVTDRVMLAVGTGGRVVLRVIVGGLDAVGVPVRDNVGVEVRVRVCFADGVPVGVRVGVHEALTEGEAEDRHVGVVAEVGVAGNEAVAVWMEVGSPEVGVDVGVAVRVIGTYS